MQTLSEIRSILAERGLRPKHRLGQNFLHDKNILGKLVDAAELEPGELVLEIGSGTGSLTEALLEAGTQVVTCELDSDLASIIEDRFAARVQLMQVDCLDAHRRLNPKIVEVLADRPFKLVANLPFQVASPLMCALLIDHPNCIGQYITVQREVADRLLARVGTKEYGPLSIIVGAFGEVKRIASIRATCFWPQPKVESTMVRLLPLGRGAGVSAGDSPGRGEGSSILDTPQHRQDFARFVTQLFTKRRKQLGSILGRDLDWPEGVTRDLRPEAVSVERIITLWKRFGTMLS